MDRPRVRFSRSATLDSAALSTPRRGRKIRRFDGTQKLASSWDGLIKDTELWSDHADCVVHFHARGAAQRPTLKIPLAALQRANPPYLLEKCLHRRDSTTASDDDTSDSGYSSSISGEWAETHCQLYIPAPSGLTSDDAIRYHLTTRNYFAFLLSKPTVGRTLGSALVDLWTRIQAWQSGPTCRDDFHRYCQEQGYLDVADNPDYALALLLVAEHARMKTAWLDAFVHCVGMYQVLSYSAEYNALSNTTQSTIVRASLEMTVRIQRVTRSICNFLEDELGPEFLGLSKDARNHLDRFRSLLLRHYVEKVGYFPPAPTDPWDKPLWSKLCRDFRCLYAYMADTHSSSDWSSNPSHTGGICVSQNVHAFDERYGCQPLPHPLPLLPATHVRKRSRETSNPLKGLKLSRSESQLRTRATAQDALALATNALGDTALTNPLLRVYVRFERTKLEEKITPAEARKVRWMLVYGVLQMLNSILGAPDEVADVDVTTYPLCVSTVDCPSWIDHEEPETRQDDTEALPVHVAAVQQAIESDRFSIRPDCDAESAEDYFTKTSISRTASTMSLATPLQPPSRVGSQLSRTASIRSSMNSIQKSVRGSLSRRNSLRRASVLLQPTRRPSRDALGPGSGTTSEGSPEHSPRHRHAVLASSYSTQDLVLAPYAFEGSSFNPQTTEEPVFRPRHPVDLDLNHDLHHGNGGSPVSVHRPSRASSYQQLPRYDPHDLPLAASPVVDPSLGAFAFDFDFDLASTPTPVRAARETVTAATGPAVAALDRAHPVARSRAVVHAGCYIPSVGPESRLRMLGGAEEGEEEDDGEVIAMAPMAVRRRSMPVFSR